MDGIKGKLICLRNGFSFTFSWLVICSIIVALAGKHDLISVSFLLKLIVFCLWGSISFTLCFASNKLQKKGFIFQLTLFFIMCVPAEILLFYVTGIIQDDKNIIMWIIFFALVVLSYVACILIDFLIMKKRASVYTEKMNEYKLKKADHEK